MSSLSRPVALMRGGDGVPLWLAEKWQLITDTIAELANVPVGLVMRVVGDEIEVLVSSRTMGNPYKPGEAMRLPDSGLYCERVIADKSPLVIHNALVDDDWKDNPDIELGMVSYLGVPILWPDHTPFGTLCILDDKERAHPKVFEQLIRQFADIIEHHLSLVHTETVRELAFAADRKHRDELLQYSEQRFRLLVEHAADDFILHDASGTILDANQKAASTAGLTKEQLRGSTIASLPFRFGDAWNEEVWASVQPGEANTLELTTTFPGMQPGAVEVRWSCQLVQGEKLFLILIRDISERLRAENAIRLAEAELARASRLTMMGQLAGSIIHEVNQPLAAIVACSTACLRWLDHEVPEIEQARASARLASQSARDASEIVSGLRSIVEKSNPVRQPVDLSEIFQDVLLLTRRECSISEVAVVSELTGQPLVVTGDPTQIKQVLLNLIMNAAEAMREITDRPRVIKVSSDLTDEGHLLFSVEDSGTGLMGTPSGRLFEPMFTTKATGMGMGLAICHSILEAHGGKIWAEDRTDETGARFNLSFPPP